MYVEGTVSEGVRLHEGVIRRMSQNQTWSAVYGHPRIASILYDGRQP